MTDLDYDPDEWFLTPTVDDLPTAEEVAWEEHAANFPLGRVGPWTDETGAD